MAPTARAEHAFDRDEMDPGMRALLGSSRWLAVLPTSGHASGLEMAVIDRTMDSGDPEAD